MAKGKSSVKKRVIVIVLAIVFFFATVIGVLQLGAEISKKTWAHWRPNYQKTDITHLFTKDGLTEEDYALLYAQTGLTKTGIDDLLSAERYDKILDIQDFYFKPNPVKSHGFAPFTYTENTRETATLTLLQDGDIIVSARMYVSFLRFGHSALVVDGAENLVIEAVSPGNKSEIAGIGTFLYSASFIVLRVKTDEATRVKVAKFARENMLGVPYRATVGIFMKKYDPQKLKASHCSHLVWYAYKKFGIDLDSTGGAVVTPRDIANSNRLEVVQVYGFNPKTLWR